MVLMELLRKRKGSQHVQNSFHIYCWQLMMIDLGSLNGTIDVKCNGVYAVASIY